MTAAVGVGVVPFHIRQQGGPQRPGLRPGYVPGVACRPKLQWNHRLPIVQTTRPRGQRRRPDGGVERPHRRAAGVLRGPRCAVLDSGRCPAARLRRRGPHRPARAAVPACRHHRGRGFHRSGPDLPDLGAAKLRQAPARHARARPPSGHDAAVPPPRPPGIGASAVTGTPLHAPVLLDEAIAALAPRDGATYVDGTFGAGGYSRALLAAANCRVIAIDRDPAAIALGGELARVNPGRFTVGEGRFGDMEALLAALGVSAVAGIALDLGVSSPQLDDPQRGFSFRADGPLDMRMGREGASAADLVNNLSESALANLIYIYGEERFARRVARAIVAARREAPLTRTAELARIVREAVPVSGTIDPATRTFQALRMEANDELGEVERALLAGERLLAPGGRLVIVAFHSLEDRKVKEFLRQRSAEAPLGSRHRPAPP